MAGPAQEVAGAAKAPEPGVTGRAGAVTQRPARRVRWLRAAACTAAAIAAIAAYARLSGTYPVNSDGANIVLMSWDMLHGNLLLHAWWMSDVSFYTTELPEYMLIGAIRGLSPDVTHIAAGLTYTLVLVLTVLLARGRAAAGDGPARVLISAGIMLAPQLGVGIFVLLLSVGHIGTAVPALAVWLILDRARPRWYIPVITAVLLAWAMVADTLVLVVAIVPLALVALFRAVRRPAPGGEPAAAASLRSAWYELSLAAAAVAAVGLSWLAQQAIHAAGGYTLHQVPFSLVAPARLGVHAAATGDSLLALFGANFGGLHSGAAAAFAVLHLAGLALVAWALARTIRRFTSCGLIDQVLAVAIVLNVVMYLFSSFSSGVLNGREIALVLPFGAALAARSLAPRLRGASSRGTSPRGAGPARMLLAVLTGTALAGSVACLGYELAQPMSPPANARLAAWLQARHLTSGLSGYWQASVVTVGTGGRVTIRAVTTAGGGLVPYRWEARSPWYDPRTRYANFVVLQNQPGFFNEWQPAAAARATFGAPAQTFRTGPYTVLVWTQNLLPALHEWAVRTGTAGTSVTSYRFGPPMPVGQGTAAPDAGVPGAGVPAPGTL
jgi:hypothetical protein